jgi:cytochrome P450
MTSPDGAAALLPPLASSGAGEWTARRDADIRAVLADPRFTVAPPGPGGPPGTVSWLRASVSRFANGAEHRGRRALVETELGRLDPGSLRASARELALDQLARCGRPGDRVDVMSLLARRVPVTALAARLGLADPLRAAAAVTAVAASYFPGSDARREQQADAETAWLVTALGPARLDTTVARIAVMVQACDATAGLIGTALHLLQDRPAAAGGSAGRDGAARSDGCPGGDGSAGRNGHEGWPTDALLAETLRRRPPAAKIRRVASVSADVGGEHIQAGEKVVCDIEAAGRNPEPEPSGAGQAAPAGLAFGAGLRPCPGPGQALALAAGVIDAVRERCALQPGTPVTYEAAPTRVPERLEVVLR